jgi:hypothetical protein
MSLRLYMSLRIGAILEKRAPPTVRAMPKLGESITFWWRHRLVRLNREIRENQHEFMQQWITCRQVESLARWIALVAYLYSFGLN